MQIPERIIEIGGGYRPIMPPGLVEYVGIDPAYTSERHARLQAMTLLNERHIHASLHGCLVEAPMVAGITPAEFVVMQNVLVNMVHGQTDLVKHAMKLVATGGELVIIENEQPDWNHLRTLEVDLQNTYSVMTFNGMQVTFENYYNDLAMSMTPKLSDKLMTVRPKQAI